MVASDYASRGVNDSPEMCQLVEHEGSSKLKRATALVGIDTGAEYDGFRLRVHGAEFRNELCAGAVGEPEIEDHHVGRLQHLPRCGQRPGFPHELERRIGLEL